MKCRSFKRPGSFSIKSPGEKDPSFLSYVLLSVFFSFPQLGGVRRVIFRQCLPGVFTKHQCEKTPEFDTEVEGGAGSWL